MKVIPVIDVLNGVAVHAVRGKRKEYQPLQSVLCKTVDPVEVAKTFADLGFSELYLADLDAITGGQPNYKMLKRIADETKLKLMVDEGVADLKKAEKLLSSNVSKVIIGTETLQKTDFVGKAVKFLGNRRVVVSLDLIGGKVMVKLGLDGCKNALCLLREFQEMGVTQVIVLDLARVGSGEGVDLNFIKQIIDSLAFEVYVGGGVRGIEDLVELKNLGVSGVLVATALHSGKISIDSLRNAGLL